MTTERKMTVKGFLRKVETSKLSASAFLAAHRNFLETGELAEVVRSHPAHAR